MVTDLPHKNVIQAETRSKREEKIQIAKAPPKTDFSVRGLPFLQQPPCSRHIAGGHVEGVLMAKGTRLTLICLTSTAQRCLQPAHRSSSAELE